MEEKEYEEKTLRKFKAKLKENKKNNAEPVLQGLIGHLVWGLRSALLSAEMRVQSFLVT